MSPQPATPAQTPPAATSEPLTLTDELIAKINKIPEDERDIPEVQFLRAVSLEQQKATIMKQITANRTFLRVMDESDALDDDLAEWLEVFYPTKEKDATRDDDQVKVTRANHLAAAKKR